MHTYSRYEVYHWDEKGRKTLLWRYLANQLIWKDDLALFHGYLTTGPDDPGGATRRSVERLFAVKGSGPVVDITDDVLKLWIGTNQTDLAKKVRTSRVSEITKKADGFSIEVYQWGGGNGVVELSRAEILNMIQEAKEKGKLMKDPGFGTPYLKLDREAELSKP